MTRFEFYADEVKCCSTSSRIYAVVNISYGNDLEDALKSVLEASLDYFGRDTTIEILKDRMKKLGYEFDE